MRGVRSFVRSFVIAGRGPAYSGPQRWDLYGGPMRQPSERRRGIGRCVRGSWVLIFHPWFGGHGSVPPPLWIRPCSTHHLNPNILKFNQLFLAPSLFILQISWKFAHNFWFLLFASKQTNKQANKHTTGDENSTSQKRRRFAKLARGKRFCLTANRPINDAFSKVWCCFLTTNY